MFGLGITDKPAIDKVLNNKVGKFATFLLWLCHYSRQGKCYFRCHRVPRVVIIAYREERKKKPYISKLISSS